MSVSRSSVAAAGLFAALVAGSLLPNAGAQESRQKPATSTTTAAVTETSSEEFRPRLPHHFGKLVDATQRERIYDLQRQRLPEIKQLEAQLEVLKKRLEAEMESVLTPSQRAELRRLRDEAAQARQNG